MKGTNKMNNKVLIAMIAFAGVLVSSAQTTKRHELTVMAVVG